MKDERIRIGLQQFANGAGVVVNYAGDNNPADAGAINTVATPPVNVGKDLSVEMKTFYDKVLIELASPKLVHDQFGQKRPIPRNGGKTIEFRKFDNLPKALTPITEGVTPVGNKLKASALTATVEQYGDYVEQTDMLELTSIDNTIVQATKKLAAQAGETLDTVVREKLNAGYNVMYAKKDNGDGTFTEVKKRSDLTKDCHLTVKDVFRAATELKAVNAPKIGDSFVAVIHPYTAYTLMQEAGPMWLDIQKYASPENMLRGEIGKLGGVRFVESTEAKIFGPAAIAKDANGTDVTRLTVKTAATAATSVVVEEELEAGTGLAIDVYVGGTANKIKAIATSNHVTTITLNSAATVAAGDIVSGVGGGKDGSAVFSTLFMAEDAYGTTDITGGGLEHIVKQRGYGNDPLNQRSSIGWKATKTAEILIEEYILRFESCSPDTSLTAESN